MSMWNKLTCSVDLRDIFQHCGDNHLSNVRLWVNQCCEGKKRSFLPDISHMFKIKVKSWHAPCYYLSRFHWGNWKWSHAFGWLSTMYFFSIVVVFMRRLCGLVIFPTREKSLSSAFCVAGNIKYLRKTLFTSGKSRFNPVIVWTGLESRKGKLEKKRWLVQYSSTVEFRSSELQGTENCVYSSVL